MRLVQILVPKGKREAVLDQLDSEGIDFAVSDETGRRNFEAIVHFPVPDAAVQPVLDRLRSLGIEDDSYTIVSRPEAVVSKRIEKLKERYSKEEIPREELESRAEEMVPSQSTFFIMVVVSTVIAATGLLLNSAAVIIGAMVIAPLMWPAVAASVGTVMGNRELVSRGVKLQLLGVIAAIVAAILFGLVVRGSVLVPPDIDIIAIPEIQSRLAPDLFALLLALGAGVAAVVSLARGVGSVIVGAMIAVALVPPAASAGMAIAWGLPLPALGATVSVLVNVFSINLAALLVLRYLGYKPVEGDVETRTKFRTKTLTFGIALAVLALFLGFVTYISNKTATTEQKVREGVAEFLGKPEYQGAELLETNFDFKVANVVFFGEIPRVIFTVGTPDGQIIPGLAKEIDDGISEALENEVSVQIRYVSTDETE